MPASETTHRKIDGTERLELTDPALQLPSAFSMVQLAEAVVRDQTFQGERSLGPPLLPPGDSAPGSGIFEDPRRFGVVASVPKGEAVPAIPLSPKPFEESSGSLKRSLAIQEEPVEE
jgi:hypothetical protein